MAGIQQRPEEYLGKKGPSSKQINRAVQQLHILGAKSAPGVLSTQSNVLEGNSDDDVTSNERPQVPPQLLYMHKLKAQKALTNKEDSVNVTLAETVVAPRAVRERIAKRKAEQEKEVYNVPASSLPEPSRKRKRGPSPFDGYEGLNVEDTLKGIEGLSPAEQIKRLQAAAINPNLKRFGVGMLGHTEGGDEIYICRILNFISN